MKSNYCLLKHNTFGIDVSARFFAEYDSTEKLKEEVSSYRSKIACHEVECTEKILHIGGGSNLLFLNDYEGLVLHSAILGIEVLHDDESNVLIRVGAGMTWDDLVCETIKRGWYGLENLSLIPGEVGASAVQNIGAYGVEVKDYITHVHLVDLQSFDELVMTNGEMQYAYRYSILKSDGLRGRYAVTYVDFKLNKSFVPHLEYGGLRNAVDKLTELDAGVLREVIIKMRQSKLPDPQVLGNAGSFFMNPVVERSIYERLVAQYPEMPHYEVDDLHIKIPAGWLIEQSGWKGKALGMAGVYEKQALVLVNLGGAKGEDVVKLCQKVVDDVKDKFGISIHPEVNFIQ